MYPHGINVPILIKQVSTEDSIIKTYSDGRVYKVFICFDDGLKTKIKEVSILSKEQLIALKKEMQEKGDKLFNK